MSARFYILDQSRVYQELTTVPREGWTLVEKAEQGAVAMAEIVIDDPSMDLDTLLGKDVGGLRAFKVVEDEFETGDNQLFYGYTGPRKVRRTQADSGGPITRAWSASLVDINTVLGWRIVKAKAAARPKETDVERVQWVFGLAIANLVDDATTYVATADPVNMDAVNYRGQTIAQVLDDCSQQSGKNWWLTSIYNAVTVEQDVTVWYGNDRLDGYPSTFSLSNDPADIDYDTCWPISEDSEVEISPDRVASGIWLPYPNGVVYQRLDSTATAFVFRDVSMPSANVKTQDKAVARANRYLSDFNEEDQRLTTKVILPKAKVNYIRAGMRISYRATHQPGFEVARDCRILERSITPKFGGSHYELGLTMIPAEGRQTLPSGCTTELVVSSMTSDYSGNASLLPSDPSNANDRDWTTYSHIPNGVSGSDAVGYWIADLGSAAVCCKMYTYSGTGAGGWPMQTIDGSDDASSWTSITFTYVDLDDDGYADATYAPVSKGHQGKYVLDNTTAYRYYRIGHWISAGYYQGRELLEWILMS